MATTHIGIVKWFSEAKGFGFIAPAEGGRDLYAHISEVQGGVPLREGQKVLYEVTQGKRGPQASKIRPA